MFKQKFQGIIIGSIITLIISMGTMSFADMQSISAYFNDIKIKINDKIIDTGTDKPFIYNGRTYVPARYVAEGLGANVKWNETDNTVEINMITKVDTDTSNISKSTKNSTNDLNFIFRNVNFGMTKEDVIKSEGSLNPDYNKDIVLSYDNVLIGNINSSVTYYFDDNNKLADILITSLETHSNKNDYIDDYNKYVNILTSKYGKPISNKTVWKNDLFKDEPEQYGLAISAGQLEYGAYWEFLDYDIFNILNGDNYQCKLSILISSKVFTTNINDGI